MLKIGDNRAGNIARCCVRCIGSHLSGRDNPDGGRVGKDPVEGGIQRLVGTHRNRATCKRDHVLRLRVFRVASLEEAIEPAF